MNCGRLRRLAGGRGYFPSVVEPDAKTAIREALTELGSSESDLGSMADAIPRLTEYLAEVAAPDFACVMAPLPPTPPVTHAGIEGLAQGWSDYGEAFENVRVELDEIVETPDHVVVLVDQIAITCHDNVEITQPSGMVFAFENGLVKRVELHLDRGAALRSAGIDPGASSSR